MVSAPPTNIITDTIRKSLTDLLREGHAHARFEDSVSNLPANLRGICPDNLPYSIWQLVEHIRITQYDIVQFCQFATYKSPEWPAGYWVENKNIVPDEEWENSLIQIKKDKEHFLSLFNNPDTDIYIPFTHGDGQTYIREALLIADHTAYHTGQIILIRRLLGAW